MVLRNESYSNLSNETELTLEQYSQATETKNYVTDLLGELQTIANVGGLDTLAADIGILLLRHLPTSN